MAFKTAKRETTRCASYTVSVKYCCQTVKPDSDHASRSSYQFVGNVEDKRIFHMRSLECSQQPLDRWKLCWTNDPVSSKNRLQMGGRGEVDRQVVEKSKG